MGRHQNNKTKFTIPDPGKAIEKLSSIPTKYSLGAQGLGFREIGQCKPVFAFDYLVCDDGDFSFTRREITSKDYVGLLQGLKKVSEHSYDHLTKNRMFRFHKIDFERDKASISIRRSDFKKALTNRPESLEDNELPNLWQFDPQYSEGARIVGFIYIGVFYLVWFDRDHKIYPGQK